MAKISLWYLLARFVSHIFGQGCLFKKFLVENVSSEKEGGERKASAKILFGRDFSSDIFWSDFFSHFWCGCFLKKFVLYNLRRKNMVEKCLRKHFVCERFLSWYLLVFFLKHFSVGVSLDNNCFRQCFFNKEMVGQICVKILFGREFFSEIFSRGFFPNTSP